MPFIGPILSIAINICTSRAGQLALAFAVAWMWSWWRTDASWRAVIAAEKAQIERQYQAEVARQAQAAQDIARDATARVEQEMSFNADLQAIIERYANEEAKPQVGVSNKTIVRGDCAIDDNFIGVVRKLSSAASKAKSAGASSKFRKTR